ncbi:hypothetical protein LCGC14_2923470, partial [marine sediment metagenome]
RFACAVGPAAGGGVVAAAALWLGQGPAGWVVCSVAGAVAGVLFVWAGVRNRQVTREAAALAWLILAVAAVALACGLALAQALFALTVVAVVSVLMGGASARRQAPDALDSLVRALAVIATAGVVVVGPLTGLGAVVAGVCLLAVAAAYWIGWLTSRAAGFAHAGNGLFALGALLVVFGVLGSVEARVAAGAGVVVGLLALASAMRRRFPDVSHGAVLTGHLTGIVLACAALVQAWPQNTWYLPLAAAPLVLCYLLMPRLRGVGGFRLGALLWLSFAALTALAGGAQTPYQQQASLSAALALVWLAAGFVLRRRAARWSMPLYVAAATLAVFCGVISLFSPDAGGAWQVFLINGIVFACLFLVFRQDVFAYLLTLSLTLTGH